MEVVFHLGAHCTDGERLVRSLLRNRGPFLERGIVVPPPGRYRPLLRDLLVALRGEPASAEQQAVLLDAVMDEDRAERLIFSHEYFLGIPQRVIGPEGFHAAAGRKVAGIANLFPGKDCEFHLALRNPATLLPALIGQIRDANYATVLGETDPMTLRWGPAVRSIVEEVPGIRLTLWCYEDSPLLWPDILRAIAGLTGDVPVEGGDDMLAQIMRPEGIEAMRRFLASRTIGTPEAWRQVAAAFLDKFARPEEMEVALPFPGWTEGLVEAITDAYDDDVEEMAALPGVEVLMP
jgi:hypothetical protein